jgi:hypothetical protein
VNDPRTLELRARLDTVRGRIAAAAEAAGRQATDVTLVVVTKTWPTDDIRRLRGLGVADIGENRHREAEMKAAELVDEDCTWHFVGQVQSNKATRIAAYADVVHSVDSVRVAQRLNAGAHRYDRSLDCLVQVSLDAGGPGGGRGGVSPAAVEDVAEAIEGAGLLRLAGVMAVAPLGAEPAAAYERLASVSSAVQAVHRQATWISAGMSEDFEAAIAAGATHVRVGGAILGERPLLR